MRTELLAALVSGVALAAAHPPFGLAFAAVPALVPLLWVWRRNGPLRGAVYGGVAGLAFFGVLIVWIVDLGIVAYVPFVAFLALWWAAAGALTGWLARHGAASATAMAGVWTLAEAGRARVPFGGFSWGEIGYAFHDVAVVRALAGWGGVPLISFVAVLAAGLLLRVGERGRGALGVAGVAVGVVAASALLPTPRPTGTLSVAVVQGNDIDRDLTAAELAERYLPRNHLRLAAGITGPVDLVVFPESSLDADPRGDPFLSDALTGVAARLDAAVMAGGNAEAPGGRVYNTTFLYTEAGRAAPLYRKQHLVPFGEFVPWRDALSFIKALEAVPRDYAPGQKGTVFSIGGRPVGNLICFDSAFAPLAREYVGRGVEAIVVSTNNRSYGPSNSLQHVAISQLRAVETGRPIVHAGIAGVSTVVSASGDVGERTRQSVATVLLADVTTTTGETPYARLGDWVLAVAAAVVVASGAASVARRSRTPS